MRVNKSEEIDECFLSHEVEQPDSTSPQQPPLQIPLTFHKQLPANELRTSRRPEHLAPRTFFLERPPQLLPQVLNQPCDEEPMEQQQQIRLKLKISNRQNLNLQQYFQKKKFRCLYNRLETYHAGRSSFTGRLKGIDSLIDYNWKSFHELQPAPTQPAPVQDQLDSDFENGNLCRVYYIPQEPHEYYLLIENDLNTYGYNHWMFFRIRNAGKGTRKFVVANFIKNTHFYSQGMLISVFSMAEHRTYGRGWKKAGNNVTFAPVNLPREHHLNETHFALVFEYEFQQENDQVYFALNQPYTYSRLIAFLNHIHKIPKHIELEIKHIGYSVSNNIIPTLTLQLQPHNPKDIILVLARQHPCETVGSFIAEYLVKNMMEPNNITNFLLTHFQFVIVPMVNPDGVIHGMSRCNAAGLDLNRQWSDDLLKELTPETAKIKQYILSLTKSQRIRYMIDLHGHGKKLNSFFFSCKDHKESSKDRDRDNIRLLSMAMHLLEPRFHLHDCTYGITKDKLNTIRSTINNMGILHSYTLETSLHGWKDQNGAIVAYQEQDYCHIARSLINSIFLIEADPEETQRELGMTRETLIAEMPAAIERVNKEQPPSYNNNDILSESDPEGDKLDMKELLGKSENKVLRKRLQEQMDKNRKSKKHSAKHEHASMSSKNMRRTCPSALNSRQKHPSFLPKQFLLPPPLPKEINSKKVSLSEKWRQRRKEIEKKKKIEEKELLSLNANIERPNLSKMERRPRTKTQPGCVPQKALLPQSIFFSKTQLAKTKNIKQKLRTELQQAEDLSIALQQEILQTQSRKSALEIKFNQLKQDNLSNILTDSLSILKIGLLDKHISSEAKETKHYNLKLKKEHLATEPALTEHSKLIPSTDPCLPSHDRQPLRYKKFRQFLNGGSAKRMENNISSVFYHFPIL